MSWDQCTNKNIPTMVSEELGLHLLENQSEHIYWQISKKGLIYMFKMMKVAGESYKNIKLREKVMDMTCMWAAMLLQTTFRISWSMLN